MIREIHLVAITNYDTGTSLESITEHFKVYQLITSKGYLLFLCMLIR